MQVLRSVLILKSVIHLEKPLNLHDPRYSLEAQSCKLMVRKSNASFSIVGYKHPFVQSHRIMDICSTYCSGSAPRCTIRVLAGAGPIINVHYCSSSTA
jgi:hypothetical protein